MDKYYEACANNGNDYFICDNYDCISFWYLLLACVFWQALVQKKKIFGFEWSRHMLLNSLVLFIYIKGNSLSPWLAGPPPTA